MYFLKSIPTNYKNQHVISSLIFNLVRNVEVKESVFIKHSVKITYFNDTSIIVNDYE